jgi:hypothetical protein
MSNKPNKFKVKKPKDHILSTWNCVDVSRNALGYMTDEEFEKFLIEIKQNF